MSTISGRTETCEAVLSQIRSQTLRPDKVILHFDGMRPNGDLMKYADVCTFTERRTGTLTRIKATFALKKKDIVCVFDDDITYPLDYIERGVNILTEDPGLIVYHGGDWKSVNSPLGTYSLGFTVDRPTPVLVGGVGTSFAYAKTFQLIKSVKDLSPFQYSCDLLMAYLCWKNHIPIIRAPNQRKWIRWKRHYKDSVYKNKRSRTRTAYGYLYSLGWPK